MKIYFESLIIILFVTKIRISESLFCPYGEKFSFCGNNECRSTCKFPQGPKFCDPKCRPGCICYSSLVRRETDGKCVTLEECPQYSSTESPDSTGKPPNESSNPPEQPPDETTEQSPDKTTEQPPDKTTEQPPDETTEKPPEETTEPVLLDEEQQYERPYLPRQRTDKHRYPPGQTRDKHPYPQRQQTDKHRYPPGQTRDKRPYSLQRPSCIIFWWKCTIVLERKPLKRPRINSKYSGTKDKGRRYSRKFLRTRKQPGKRGKGKCSPRRYQKRPSSSIRG